MSCLKQVHVYSRQIKENPPFKGGWLKIGYSQEGRDEPEYPKSRISSKMAPSFAALHMEWSKEAVLRIEPSITSGTGHSGQAAGKGLRWMELQLRKAIVLNPRGKHITTALGVTWDWLTPDTQDETRGILHGSANSTSHMTWIHHGCMWL